MSAKKTNTGTNLERLKQAFQASNSEGGGSYSWFKPDWGDNVVRVLPSVDGDGLFFEETARHRINGEWFYCLKYKIDEDSGRGMACPICDARTRLFRAGDQDLIKIAKEIKAKKQYLINLVERKGNEQPQVKLYGAGVKIWNKMVTTMIDDEIDITDVEEGYDFLIKKEEGPKTEFGTFPNYDNSKAKRKSTPLDEDDKVAAKLLDARTDLKEVSRFDEPDILQRAVDSYIKGMTDTSSDETFYSEGESKDEEAPAKSSPKAKANVTNFKDKLAAQLRSEDD